MGFRAALLKETFAVVIGITVLALLFQSYIIVKSRYDKTSATNTFNGFERSVSIPVQNETDLAMNRTDPATRRTDPATNRTDPATHRTHPAINRTDPATNRTIPATNRTMIEPKWSDPRSNLTESMFWKQVATTGKPSMEIESLIAMLPKIPQEVSSICRNLLNDTFVEARAVYSELDKRHPYFLNQNTHYMNESCEKLKEGFLLRASKEEMDFPIAYSLLVYKDVEQVFRLLKAIYRPSNYYCIHVDGKAEHGIHDAFIAIAKCFPNVFLSSKRVHVIWGTYSVLEADLICMKQLLNYTRWRYFINLTGQEFPLKTNLDIINTLRTFDGAADVEGARPQGRFLDRTKFVAGTNLPKSPPPEGIKIAVGSVHVALPRDFVTFIFTKEVALTFNEWVKDTHIPDETFFASLAHSPELNVPGAHLDGIGTINRPSITRFKRWAVEGTTCGGYWQRGICLMNVKDLYLIRQRPELFLNKIILHTNNYAFQCLEYLHYERTKLEYLGKLEFITTFYKNLEFVHNHI